MTPALFCLLLAVPTAGDAAAARSADVERYLARCESAKAEDLREVERKIEALAKQDNRSAQEDRQLGILQALATVERGQPATLLPLALPPAKGDVGTLVPPNSIPPVEVLEIIDADDAIVRAWYAAEASEPRERTVPGATTFTDVWIHGVDTTGYAVGTSVALDAVFHVAGNQVFDTTCGGRSVLRLEAIDLESHRAELAVAGARRPASDDELRRWLENMVWHHGYSVPEIRQATGLTADEIQAVLKRFDIRPETKPARESNAPLLVLPYPGGRHPRVGFLEGAIRPQRETKLSVFLPWNDASYVVVDVPEAIRRDDEAQHGLLYLAHTHVDTMWTKQGLELASLEWRATEDGGFEIERTLPDDVCFGTRAVPGRDAVRMEMWLANGSDAPLRELRVQNCVMLKGAREFAEETAENTIYESPFVARRSSVGDRWLIVAWEPCQRTWANPPCPCLHSDPQFGDCELGQSQQLRGWLSFYEGTDIRGELQRIRDTGWLTVPAEPESKGRAAPAD